MKKMLKLNRVTLRNLDDSSLGGVVGGLLPPVTVPNCNPGFGQTSECHASDFCTSFCGGQTTNCTSYSLQCAPTPPATPGSDVASACAC
jgi:hypothetical protein